MRFKASSSFPFALNLRLRQGREDDMMNEEYGTSEHHLHSRASLVGLRSLHAGKGGEGKTHGREGSGEIEV